MIKELTIITAQGVKSYQLGEKVNGQTLTTIKVTQLYFTGDPFDHYCGYDENGKMLFSVNCLALCEVVYCA
jgi:hypothetical protein